MLQADPQHLARPHRWRKLAFRCLACGLSLTLACALAELGLRLGGFSRSYANPFASFHERDPVLGWRGKPNFSARLTQRDFDVVIAHDEHGFRRRVTQPGAVPAPKSVFVLGDSFAWGWGVGQEQICTARLERLLPETQVHNLGLCGTGTVQQFAIFQQHVQPRLRPGDAVVLTFYGNDFNDNVGRNPNDSLHAKIEAGEIRLVPPSGRFCPSVLKNQLKDASYLFNLVTYSADRLRHALADWKDSRDLARGAGCRRNRPGDTLPTEGTLADDAAEVQITRHYLAEFQTACAERRVEFCVTYIPFQVELGETDFAAGGEAASNRPSPERQAFFRCAECLGLEAIDLLPPFLQAKAAHPAARLTFAHDVHWNAEGHALVADVLAARLGVPSISPANR